VGCAAPDDGEALQADVAVILGTRPEAIKFAPVVLALRARGLTVRVIASGQHRDLLQFALTTFGLRADIDLQAMQEDQRLADLTGRLVPALSRTLREDPPRMGLVQGDATTSTMGALACFYEHIPCGHVEAGLRSYRRMAPWPEEINRLLADRLCTRLYPPTEDSRSNLVREGLDPALMVVTGQTGVDAALMTAARLSDDVPEEIRDAVHPSLPLVYCTGHRRESLDGGIRSVALAMQALVQRRPEVQILWPMHPNPAVRRQLHDLIGRHDRLRIVSPVSYPCSIWLMRRASAIVSDSGGIQEEAPSFGVPVLVTRDVTERPEGLAAGFLTLVGTRTEVILEHLERVLDDSGIRDRLKATPNPYGDGRASERITDDVVRMLNEPVEC
jgi:UDP-N-acetylglucosamine 2-epimerase (non-hydrolysing)